MFNIRQQHSLTQKMGQNHHRTTNIRDIISPLLQNFVSKKIFLSNKDLVTRRTSFHCFNVCSNIQYVTYSFKCMIKVETCLSIKIIPRIKLGQLPVSSETVAFFTCSDPCDMRTAWWKNSIASFVEEFCGLS